MKIAFIGRRGFSIVPSIEHLKISIPAHHKTTSNLVVLDKSSEFFRKMNLKVDYIVVDPNREYKNRDLELLVVLDGESISTYDEFIISKD